MEEQVRRALEEAGYDPEEILLEVTSSGNVGGFVISRRFVGKSQIERQQELWVELKRRLNAEQLKKIVAILTMTPDEADDDVRAEG